MVLLIFVLLVLLLLFLVLVSRLASHGGLSLVFDAWADAVRDDR